MSKTKGKRVILFLLQCGIFVFAIHNAFSVQAADYQAALVEGLAMLMGGDIAAEAPPMVLAQAKSSLKDSKSASKNTNAPVALFIKDGVITYPVPDTGLKKVRPIIGADYKALSKQELDLTPVLIIDGKDVTLLCDTQQGYIFFTPDYDMAQGRHDVIIKLTDQGRTGKVIASWSFFVSGPEPLKLAYPPPDTSTGNKRPVIGLNLAELPQDMDPGTVRLFVDGKDVTEDSDYTDEYIFFRPGRDMKLGGHKVEIVAQNATGTKKEKIAWNFNVSDMAVGAQYAEKTEPEKPEPETTPEATSDGTQRDPHESASIIATTKRHTNKIAEATHQAEAVLGPPPMQYPVGYQDVMAQTEKEPGTGLVITEKPGPETDTGQPQGTEEPPTGEEGVEEIVEEGGLEYALETSYGFENMGLDGNSDLSSQRARNAFIYRIGLRTQMDIQSDPGKAIFNTPKFSTNLSIEGTTDGDETESALQIKKFTGILEDETKQIKFYEVQPKYTPYSLTGQRLLGGEMSFSNEKSKFHLFGGKFKKPRAGNNIDIYGMRYSNETPSGMQWGIYSVTMDMQRVRGGTNQANSLYGVDVNKKYKYGDTKFEWAKSRYTDLQDDMAYKMEGTYRKDKTYLSMKYERVGSYFRTESGFASHGLVEFNSSLQYKFNNQYTGVFGFRRRSFMEGGSHTVSMPFVLKATPLKSRPTTTFEYRYNLVNYTKGSNWKDTFTRNYDLRHSLGTSQVQFSFKKERKKRNNRDDENERVMNMNVRSPISMKTDLTYKLTKLNNNIYGPESKNVFSVSYELSDWSDFRFALEKINKVQSTLDRTTKKLRYGQVNPDTNTEMALEFSHNKFLYYQESFLRFKYSVFY